MSYVRIDSSVPRHRKFLKAGPAASWLWVCGLAYCQEGLTDGFVPREAIATLGVEGALRLASKLVSAGLWEAVEGGWQIHDYLEHNRDAETIRRLRSDRSRYGKQGAKQRAKQDAKQGVQAHSQACVDVVVAEAVVVAEEGKKRRDSAPPMDRWFRELAAAYPQQSVTKSHLTEQAFVQALLSHDGGPEAGWALMRENLESQKAGHQWRVKRMVPRLDNWLREGLWVQRHEADAPAATVSDSRVPEWARKAKA